MLHSPKKWRDIVIHGITLRQNIKSNSVFLKCLSQVNSALKRNTDSPNQLTIWARSGYEWCFSQCQVKPAVYGTSLFIHLQI